MESLESFVSFALTGTDGPDLCRQEPRNYAYVYKNMDREQVRLMYI